MVLKSFRREDAGPSKALRPPVLLRLDPELHATTLALHGRQSLQSLHLHLTLTTTAAHAHAAAATALLLMRLLKVLLVMMIMLLGLLIRDHDPCGCCWCAGYHEGTGCGDLCCGLVWRRLEQLW